MFNSKKQESPEAAKTVSVSDEVVKLTQGIGAARGRAAELKMTRFTLGTTSKEYPHTVTFNGNHTRAALFLDGKDGPKTEVYMTPSVPNDPESVVNVTVNPPEVGSELVKFKSLKKRDEAPVPGSEQEKLLLRAIGEVTAVVDTYWKREGDIVLNPPNATKRLAGVSLEGSNIQRPQD